MAQRLEQRLEDTEMLHWSTSALYTGGVESKSRRGARPRTASLMDVSAFTVGRLLDGRIERLRECIHKRESRAQHDARPPASRPDLTECVRGIAGGSKTITDRIRLDECGQEANMPRKEYKGEAILSGGSVL